MLTTTIESHAALIALLTPLIGVPLGLITFYLRSLRENQQSWAAEFRRRIAALEAALRDLRRADADFARDYTTKEEWLRELLHARRLFERLSERTCRLETHADRARPARHDPPETKQADGAARATSAPAATRPTQEKKP
ncbi:MAG: hypothetical protein J5J06_02825 [Phycisphaerae bacterium]|nr:hypothetical protein [Phycisphaerae bacterium]